MVTWWRWAPAASASAVVAVVAAALALGPVPRAIAIACVLASWIAAAVFRRGDARTHASAVAAIAAVTAAGQVQGGVLYGVLVAAFLLLTLSALRTARSTDAPHAALAGRTSSRRTWSLAVIFGTAGAIAALTVVFLPPLAARVERFVTGILDIDGFEATAFSTRMVLGATRGMLQSNAIVLRIDGEHPAYLRGAVYDRYDRTAWLTTMPGRERRTIPPLHGGQKTTITLDRNAPNGADMRWFLPPGACDLDLAVEIDAFGIARRGPGPAPAHIAYATTGCRTAPAPILAPTATDLDVPTDVARVLAPIARAWIADATTDREKLRAIQHELARFEYSLAVPRQQGIDPIVDFLTVHRAGHCEMFASAMVLLARTQGIRARVVGGYRVTEVNPLTGQSIVRDRNAHAWVEAFIDDGWRAWDPTPISDASGSNAGFLDHAGDLWALFTDRLVALGPLGAVVALVILIAVLFVIRWLTTWVRAPRRHARTRSLDRPLPCFEALTNALARAGHERDESEPIERFAERLRPASADIADAIVAYAGLRYGDVGDERDVVRRVEAAARATSSLSPSSR